MEWIYLASRYGAYGYDTGNGVIIQSKSSIVWIPKCRIEGSEIIPLDDTLGRLSTDLSLAKQELHVHKELYRRESERAKSLEIERDALAGRVDELVARAACQGLSIVDSSGGELSEVSVASEDGALSVVTSDDAPPSLGGVSALVEGLPVASFLMLIGGICVLCWLVIAGG